MFDDISFSSAPAARRLPNQVLGVGELNRLARRGLEQLFPLCWVGGEISNLVRASSGHLYFTLKDREAQVRCAMFRSRAQGMSWPLADGQQVEAQARVTLYEARGEFQLNVEALRRAGTAPGQRYEQFLKLRAQLTGEGLFAVERKQALPPYPHRVGIVTSPQAAALHDVIAAFARRAAHVELIVYPTLVQGADAPAAIMAALRTAFERAECDVLLLVRGGGSLEDLWAFNDEALVRLLAVPPAPTFPPAKRMPVISGVGHETDTTLVDDIADRRAATPTAAAELASAGWFAAAANVNDLAEQLVRAIERQLLLHAQTIDRLALRLVHPQQRLAAHRQQLQLFAARLAAAALRRFDQRALLDRYRHRLRQSMSQQLAVHRDRLARHAGALAALSPQATLDRGYSIVRDGHGRIVVDAHNVREGDALAVQFAHGETQVKVVARRLQ